MLHESIALCADVRLAPAAVKHEQAKWQIVEQLVGDDDSRQGLIGHFCQRRDVARMHRTLLRGNLDGGVAHHRSTRGCAGGHCASERARACADLYDVERIRSAEVFPPRIECASDDRSKERSNLWRCKEVTAAPRPSGASSGVETVVAVKGQPNEFVEADCSVAGRNRPTNFFSRRRHRRGRRRRRNAGQCQAGLQQRA